jgi:hypothetical protein
MSLIVPKKTQFIKWPVEMDDKFRARYFEVTGELIQDYPLEVEGHFVVGSSRITDEHIKQLYVDFPHMSIEDEAPSPKIDDLVAGMESDDL